MRLRSYSSWFVLVAAVAVVAMVSALVVPAATRSSSALAQTTAISTTVAARAPADFSAPCTFVPTQNCLSTDHTVGLNIEYYGDTSACTFVWNVDWGDGNSDQNLKVTDPPDGDVLLTNHTYAAAGTYTISVTGDVTSGTCAADPFTRTFFLIVLPDLRTIGALLASGKLGVKAYLCLTGNNDQCIETTLELLGITIPKSQAEQIRNLLKANLVAACGVGIIAALETGGTTLAACGPLAFQAFNEALMPDIVYST